VSASFTDILSREANTRVWRKSVLRTIARAREL
jgi:hypothetical protein